MCVAVQVGCSGMPLARAFAGSFVCSDVICCLHMTLCSCLLRRDLLLAHDPLFTLAVMIAPKARLL